jgi:hypothetical protein
VVVECVAPVQLCTSASEPGRNKIGRCRRWRLMPVPEPAANGESVYKPMLTCSRYAPKCQSGFGLTSRHRNWNQWPSRTADVHNSGLGVTRQLDRLNLRAVRQHIRRHAAIFAKSCLNFVVPVQR